ncbi:hypothetical protein HNQ71_006899 [Mesorhizobium sangaii]|uniref:Uncharacterized protein n=1 Tax=Mesorhizobium sangaii TaxID=505389 RepID=A0A841PUG7_9HYPH|nr:hypothetical protein [Mesorhizobium sangaii]
MFGQVVALRDIEDGEALQKRHGPRLVAIGPCAVLLVFGNKAVGMHDGRAVFALPDIAAKGKRLPEGQPVLAGV